MRFILFALAAAGLVALGYFAALNRSDAPADADAAPARADGLAVQAQQRGALFARRGDTELTYDDVHGFMEATIPEADRGGFLRNPRRIAEMIDNLIARHGIAELAIAQGALARRDVEAEILHKAVNTLFEDYIDAYVEERLLDDYEDQAREAYLLEPDRFSGPRTVTFRHLLIMPAASGGEVPAMERTLEIQRQLEQDPARFDALIEEYSQDPQLDENGGLYERIEPEMLEPRLANALDEMEPGTLSDPIRTQHGWHFVALERWQEPETPDYEEVRDRYIEQARINHRADLHEGLVQEMLTGELYLPEGAVAQLLERYDANVDISNADVGGSDAE